MAQVIKTTFKLRRGVSERWAEVNPILAAGEPGFVSDLNKLKIGNGITPWNDLPYIEGKSEVENYPTLQDFPKVGDPSIIYKAADELSIYQFNAKTQVYEKLSDGRGIDNIKIINGGKANGTD